MSLLPLMTFTRSSGWICLFRFTFLSNILVLFQDHLDPGSIREIREMSLNRHIHSVNETHVNTGMRFYNMVNLFRTVDLTPGGSALVSNEFPFKQTTE